MKHCRRMKSGEVSHEIHGQRTEHFCNQRPLVLAACFTARRENRKTGPPNSEISNPSNQVTRIVEVNRAPKASYVKLSHLQKVTELASEDCFHLGPCHISAPSFNLGHRRLVNHNLLRPISYHLQCYRNSVFYDGCDYSTASNR